MKKLLLLISFAIFSLAETYFSIHQIPDIYYHKVGFKNQIMNPELYKSPLLYKNYLLINKTFLLNPNQELHPVEDQNATFLRKEWCGDKWQRARVYLPSGLKNFTFGLYVIPNATIVGILTFIPDGDPHPSLDMTKVKYIEEFNYNKDAFYRYFLEGNHPIYWPIGNVGNFLDFDYLKDKSILSKKSGWIYLDFIQASEVEYSWGGHRNSPKVTLSVQYYLKDDRSELEEWFKKTKFDQYGDPVEDFSEITETIKSCSEANQKVTIFGNGEGSYLALDEESTFSTTSQSNSQSTAQSSNSNISSSKSSKSSVSSSVSQNVSSITSSRKCGNGQILVDGMCVPVNGESSSFSSSDISMKTNNTNPFPEGGATYENSSVSSSPVSQNSRKCGNNQILVDGVCTPIEGDEGVSSTSSSVSSTQSSSSSRSTSTTSSTEDFDPSILADRKFPINGFFLRYGDGAYDYVYVTSDGKLLGKLEGVDSEGHFKYKKFTPEEANLTIKIDLENGVVIITKAKE